MGIFDKFKKTGKPTAETSAADTNKENIEFLLKNTYKANPKVYEKSDCLLNCID